MCPSEHPARPYTNRDQQQYTPFSDASRRARLPSLAEQLGGEPYLQHPTRWYEWLAGAFHLVLLAAGIAVLLLG